MPRNKLSAFDLRLREIISSNLKRYSSHLTQAQLSDMTGIPTSTLSGYFAKRSTPNAGNIQKIADALGIDKSEIDPRFSTNEGSKIPTTFPKHSDAPALFRYPYFDESVSAGQLENCNGIIDAATIDVPDLLMGKYARDPDIVFMHVNGESMNRVIEDGALIAVRRLSDRYMYNNGDIVIATNGHDYTVKRMYDDPAHRQLILNPDSTDPAFHPIVIPYDSEDSYQLYGKVVIYSVIL